MVLYAGHAPMTTGDALLSRNLRSTIEVPTPIVGTANIHVATSLCMESERRSNGNGDVNNVVVFCIILAAIDLIIEQ